MECAINDSGNFARLHTETFICSPANSPAVENTAHIHAFTRIRASLTEAHFTARTVRSALNRDRLPPDTQRALRNSMGSNVAEPITQLLLRWRAGEAECFDQLIPLVDNALRRIAHRYMRNERLGHTLQTTALMNEAYMKL